MLERCKEVRIHILLLLANLIFKHLALDDRVVLLGVCGGYLLTVDAEFKDVDRGVVALSNLSQWAKFAWNVRDEGRLNERRLDQLFEDVVSDLIVL